MNRLDVVSAEISSYEEMLAKSAQLRKQVDQAVMELGVAYSNIVETKAVFEDVKKQNIEEVRLYRQTIRREAAEIAQAANEIKAALRGATIADLREFVSLCERLNALREKGFVFPSLGGSNE